MNSFDNISVTMTRTEWEAVKIALRTTIRIDGTLPGGYKHDARCADQILAEHPVVNGEIPVDPEIQDQEV